MIVPNSLALGDKVQQERRSVPAHILHPNYAKTGEPPAWSASIDIKTPEEIEKMREAGRLARKMLDIGGQLVKVGITTDEIDRILHEEIVQHNAYPSTLNYMGFPKSVCTSVNNVIAHGIPDSRPLQDGDIINIDITVFLNGVHGDNSATFYVGNVDQKGRELVEATKRSLDLAVDICKPGTPFQEIGRVICDYAESKGFSVSTELSGHGIGREFHSLPLILHHRNHEEGVMQPGMTFTIEPILCQGTAVGMTWPDRWTIVTADAGRSAQFEHTLLITQDGVEILTRND
ncbi:methionine aminopeptidase [Basidiobolus meristosporus CBS 931.73]|uniref:Methionine aminopeptidase n=1 Tax=Basidiobolus meristosporus CBS 931.73 TaxID=1314790 RepID=A0A1Y1XXJ0_9FUNG|nr:methionine aminopeptidase [Basidiobolus meristosporus CBS 931.73]|eukprot:ORX90461.1 methionine aminopeptidase [Basidiobolus meristosporus CBS 931.73]